jgi:hypothetical protein
MEAPIPRSIERLASVLLILASATVRSEEPSAAGAPVPSTGTPAALAALDRGLAYLLRTQEPEGFWKGAVGRKVHTRYIGHEAPHVGITALAGSSLLARKDAVRFDAVRRALRWVLDQSREDGFIAAHGSRMYSHALATLFLARAMRSELAPGFPDLEEKLGRAAGLIVRTQNAQGGWRYLPGAADSDLSVTACQVAALREARDAGVDIPDETFRRAVMYVCRSAVPGSPTDPSPSGAFGYQLPGATPQFGPRQSFALTAAAVAALADAGEAELDEAVAGRRYLVLRRPPPENAASRFDYYYGHFHALRAHRSDAAGCRAWREALLGELQSLQAHDGSWSDLVGPKYATAMATLLFEEALVPPVRAVERK